MTRNAAVGFHGGMLINEWALLVCVTLDASRVGAGGESRLFKFETAMWIVAIAALHGSFQYLVMEGHNELVLLFTMAAQAKLRFAGLQQLDGREAGLLRIRFRDENVRGCELPALFTRVRRVAIDTTDVVAPVFTAPEVVVFFSAGVTSKTTFGHLFRRLVFEGDDLLGIAFLSVCLAGTMARFATRHLALPTRKLR